MRAAIQQAERQEREARRAAQLAFDADQEGKRAPPVVDLETPDEKKVRRARAESERQRLKALKRDNPDAHFINQHVTPEAQAHGIYAPDTTPGPNIIKKGKEVPTSIEVVRNRGGTAIERWHARGSLDGEALNAIQGYISAWHYVFGEPRVTANWSMAAGGKGSAEENVTGKLAAKEMLGYLDDEVFFGKPLHYFEVWQNVVIFDEAAGRAGSRLGFKNDGAEAAAKAIVILIAGEIAIAMRSRRRAPAVDIDPGLI